jgi:hypothetical protein
MKRELTNYEGNRKLHRERMLDRRISKQVIKHKGIRSIEHPREGLMEM